LSEFADPSSIASYHSLAEMQAGAFLALRN
jgi:hypothetical protein